MQHTSWFDDDILDENRLAIYIFNRTETKCLTSLPDLSNLTTYIKFSCQLIPD